MPTPLSSSFASAAAGSHNEASGRSSGRGDANAAGDWSRRPNGSTQTFRRTSTATSQATHQRETSGTNNAMPPQSAGAYVPPHLNALRNAMDSRYTREQLLDLYQHQRDAGELSAGLDELAVGDWPDTMSNGVSGTKWGRRDEHKADYAHGPEACWDRHGNTEPLALTEMTDEEREIFSTSVNSPLKGAQQGGAREGGHREGTAGRKSSMSQNHLYGLTSPTSTRPSNRRREPSESYPFPRDALSSPTAGAGESGPDAQDYGFFRRGTDNQATDSDSYDQAHEKEPPGQSGSVFGSLRRTGTGPLSGGLNGPSSPWAASQATNPMSPMGAFGNFGVGSTKRAESGASRESRFRDLLKSSAEDEQRGLGGLGRLEEDPQDFGGLPGLSGREAAGGVNEPAPQLGSRFGHSNPARRQTEEAGFGSYAQRAFAEQQGGYQSQQTYNEQRDSEGPSSPTYTNPYASPQQRMSNMRGDPSDDMDTNDAPLPGLGGFGQEPQREPFAGRGGLDRMASFGVDRGHGFGGGSRGFPSLGGLGSLPGLGGANDPWSSRSRGGTPIRERQGLDNFGDPSTRSPAAAFQSPSIGGPFGGPFGGGAPLGRSSRLGSMPPTSVGEQGRDDYAMRSRDEEETRYNDMAYQTGRGKFDDFLGGIDKQSEHDQPPFHAAPGHTLSQQSSFGGPPQKGISASTASQSQPPTSQQKTMVMPDRIRWIYRDPQGNVQGPWSGLEMHDWYRAGFFSPELLVKKQEDDDYEPLAQLIRRIGNSREPFLVPQIGIPHASSAQSGNPWPNPAVTSPSTAGAPSAQPPFAGSFPSFGTTLTADQQNALERRKQEEQTLMARQKEHLAYQQVMHRQLQGGQGYSQQLHHHSSAQSLHSQPSYGSMTSPNGFNSATPHSLAPGAPVRNDAFLRGAGPIGSGAENLGQIREEDASGLLERLNLGRRQPSGPMPPIGRPQYSEDEAHDERTNQMRADRARLEREQLEAEMQHQREQDEQSFGKERLQQFHDLQRQHAEEEEQSYVTQQLGRNLDEHVLAAHEATAPDSPSEKMGQRNVREQPETPQRNLSLTEQVQKAASAKQSPAVSAWPKAPEAVPPQSSSPLPAPSARRGGPSLAESLAAESLPQTSTPSVETPTGASSLAPWAREQQEAHKQPSLKEIQEAEAKRAAKQEEIAAATRRAAAERQAANQPPPPAPGLPSSSTWGGGDAPPAASAAVTSAWAKSAAAKTASIPTTVKKTLQQIQQEEEAAARRRKTQAASNASMAGQIAGTAQAMSTGGKRYADLAGKVASPSPPTAGSWTTVGASGKTKAPPTPVVAPIPATTTRSASGTIANMASKVTKPSTSASKTTLANAQQQAQEEFKKWALGELRADLSKGISADEFVSTLLAFPADTDMITEVVHQNSRTLDSRHFAEEWVRRRALADKGKVDAVASGSASGAVGGQHNTAAGGESKGSSGWSEVARKGSSGMAGKEKEEGMAFKVVAGKKKGGKR